MTAVGDPFQAIYGWRGAAASNIISFPLDFTTIDNDPAPTYSLVVNRRSGPVILAAANQLVEPVRQRNEVLADAAVELVAAPDKAPGDISVGQFLTVVDEVSWIADDIVSRHYQGARAGGVDRWGDIAVLLRTNADITALFAALSQREVPVEIVGLGGLLELAPIADIVATLRLLHDPSDNPAALRLLTGPRWRIGRHDLQLLGKRARTLARQYRKTDTSEAEHAISVVDRADTVALIDAIIDPGETALSSAARQRCRAFADELHQLRPYPGESPLDLVRRIVTVTGMDIELVATTRHEQHCYTDQLATFYAAVGQFVDAETDISLAAFLAYLEAEAQVGVGLEQVVRNDPNSVKLLTAHKAKGLEWDVVYLPSLVKKKFPGETVTDNWVTASHVLPARLRGDAHAVPQLRDGSKPALDEYADKLKEELRDSEDRLGYVACTRARQHLIGTCHWWSASGSRLRKPSDYFLTVQEAGATVVAAVEEPAATESNPLAELHTPVSWPAGADPDEISLRREGAALVSSAITAGVASPIVTETLDAAELLARWDRDIAALVEEAQQARAVERPVVLPDNLTATQVMFAHRDPQRFAAHLVRPMPRPPAGAAVLGTRFHSWVEQRFNQSALFDLEDILDDEECAVRDEADFRELCERFAAGQFGERMPLEIEFPFTVTLQTMTDPLQIRGRIDAIYEQ
ncbi:MAG: 3'-5' exonuclease, partial [Propionibacteriaceae bacterium]